MAGQPITALRRLFSNFYAQESTEEATLPSHLATTYCILESRFLERLIAFVVNSYEF